MAQFCKRRKSPLSVRDTLLLHGTFFYMEG